VAELLLVRHAQSTWNAAGRWQGHADPPLSAEGRLQVRQAAVGLAFANRQARAAVDLFVASDLRRAIQTARLLRRQCGLDSSWVWLRDLRERHVGDWSGLTSDEIDARWPKQREAFRRKEAEVPGGETHAEFEARVRRAATHLAALVARRACRRVLVVAHGGVIRALAEMEGLGSGPLANLSGYGGYFRPGGLVLEDKLDLCSARIAFQSPNPRTGRGG